MPLESGYLLNNRYRIDQILGQGGMGAVYLATDENLSVLCAVKENLNLSPDSERQFRREATLLASLNHPHLPRVTNHFILGGHQYLVMDYVEGEDLKQRLARAHPLPVVDVLKWAEQICEALSYLHQRTPPVIHRDIKPANIKLTVTGDAMLVDFGIAKATPTGQRTTTSAVALTPGFAPPEQYGMGRTDARTDEYALAATLYVLLTGHVPPDSMDRLLGNVELQSPEQLRPDIPPATAVALKRALSVKPDDRYNSVTAFKNALVSQTPPPEMPTVREAIDPTAVQSALPTVMATPATKLAPPPAPATMLASRPPAPAAPARPLWLIPAGLGGGILIGIVILAVIGGALLLPGLLPRLNPTATRAPTPTSTATPPAAGRTPTETRSVSVTLVLTDTPTPAPPTETYTPVPLPTVVGTPVGNGGRIAFISNRDGQYFQVYTMQVDGSDIKQLTFDARNKWDSQWFLRGTQLAWSPDGTRLLYVADGGGANGLDIWMINLDGTNQVDLTTGLSGWPTGDDAYPAWGTDGTIWFTSKRSGNAEQIFYTTLADVANEIRPRNFSYTHNSPTEWDAEPFPDNKNLMLVTTSYVGWELRRYPLDSPGSIGKTFRTEKAAGFYLEDPAISADGEYVLYTARNIEDGAREIIWTKMTDRTAREQLTHTGKNMAPQWSPDGKWIVYVSIVDQNREIFIMTVSGTGQKNLTNNPAAMDTDPVWQPLAGQP